MLPFVEEEFETIRAIIRGNKSIARYGDGELRMCLGKDLMMQKWTPDIGEKLCVILKERHPHLLIGIPRTYGRHDLKQYRPKQYACWVRHSKKKFMRLLNPNKKYYSAFISRPDSAISIDCAYYWDMVRRIWKGKHVVYLSGSIPNVNKRALLSNAFRVEYIQAPHENAFDKYEELMDKMRKFSKEQCVLLLALGPTATVMAHDLCCEGYQALDIGHMIMFYNRIHPKARQEVAEIGR